MILIDTSIWIQVFRDKQGLEAQRIQEWINGRKIVLTRFIQLELLQGCRDENEWQLLSSYLEGQTYIEPKPSTWQAAARLYFDLRRQGLTVRSPIDCCIAQIALENRLILLHDDKDFLVIAKIRPLIMQHWQSRA
jgi:predicted nucleic acid-binding protein